ncbi:baseplate component protein [Streptococcus phage SW13]|uniref:Baseplate component protein n=1 Tax=Streptococcus phage SW13 TaxID=2419633 RepID=A0A3S7W9M5_9CAUD|nr:minor tail protein [Streptococcus phage SW13]AYP29514.1 baseplate component protein [Streptococcus phage SW13]AYP30337.1 baseplate component protein [Streptococcus phage SW31]AYP30378.1 baseplate component protein [Streptococcus phage SW33]AYR04558.1 baseplate component protein [Streptococcus phage SW32]
MAEFWSNNDRGYRIRLWVDQVSQDKVANTSQVRFQLALLNTTTTFAQYQCSAYIDFEGQRLNWSGSPSVLGWYQTIPLIDQTVTINHDSDGKKTFSFSAQFNGGGGWSPRTLTISGISFTLTDIPRLSSVSVDAGTIGSSVTININRQSSSFKHTVRYAWANKSGTIASNVDTSTTWTIPLDFANDFPNSETGTGTIYVDTYSEGTMIGTQSATLTASVPASMKPTFTGISLSDSNTAARNVVQNANTFIQIMSNIKVSFNGASGSYGSNITGYRAEIVGKNQTTNVNGGTLGIMNYNGTITVRASVSDSRGRWSDTRDVTVTVLEYFAPSLKIDVKRVGETSSTLEIIRNAQIAPLNINGIQKNTMKLTFKVSPNGKDDYTTDTGPASGEWLSISSLVNSPANLAGIYAANKSWEVLAILEDKFTSTSFKAQVPVESVVLSYDRDGLGIGKIREFGALDVAGDIYANNSQIQQYQLTSNNGGPKGNVDNANNLYEPGQYCLGPSAPGNPNGQWGFLFHYSYNGNNTDGIKEAIQTFWSNNGQMFFRHHRWSKIIDDWEPWIDYTPKKEKPVVKKEIEIGWFLKANIVRKSNVVTLSLIRDVHTVPPGEYRSLDEKIPYGFRPCVQTHLVANKNSGWIHNGCAVWHLESSGDMFYSNPSADNAIYTGTVTYITEDEYPNN